MEMTLLRRSCSSFWCLLQVVRDAWCRVDDEATDGVLAELGDDDYVVLSSPTRRDAGPAAVLC